MIVVGGEIYRFYYMLKDENALDKICPETKTAIEAFNKVIKNYNDYVMGYTDENSQSTVNTFNNQ